VKASSAAEPAGAQFDARYIARVLDHERRLQDLERRAKPATTVFQDLDTALPTMNREQLEGLVSLLDQHVLRMNSAAAAARTLLRKTPPADGDN
jgi:hypothetical protein